MSFGDIPSVMYFKTVDTSETPHLGTFTLADDMQLQYARLLLFKKGLTVSTQQFRIAIMSANASATAIATSDWFDLIDVVGITTNWIGFIRFDFAGGFLDASSSYYVQFETANYTRNGDTEYIGLSLDWPNPINSTPTPTDPPIGIELYGTL